MTKYLLSNLEYELQRTLKEVKKHNTYASQLENEIILYKQENARLKERLDIAQTAYLSINEKNNKAIEYIEEWQGFPHTNGSTHEELRNLKTILLGVDKE